MHPHPYGNNSPLGYHLTKLQASLAALPHATQPNPLLSGVPISSLLLPSGTVRHKRIYRDGALNRSATFPLTFCSRGVSVRYRGFSRGTHARRHGVCGISYYALARILGRSRAKIASAFQRFGFQRSTCCPLFLRRFPIRALRAPCTGIIGTPGCVNSPLQGHNPSEPPKLPDRSLTLAGPCLAWKCPMGERPTRDGAMYLWDPTKKACFSNLRNPFLVPSRVP
jgi:hypothetical protein